MTFVTLGLAAGTMLLMALVFSYILGWANTAFHVEMDPRVDAVMDSLPGANCGGCGFIGCGEYAEGGYRQCTGKQMPGGRGELRCGPCPDHGG
ncbi:MAG: (Fe-S)-binding protein [Desulfobacterales bacterium]